MAVGQDEVAVLGLGFKAFFFFFYLQELTFLTNLLLFLGVLSRKFFLWIISK